MILWRSWSNAESGEPENWQRLVRQYGMNTLLYYLTEKAGVPDSIITGGFYTNTTQSPQQYISEQIGHAKMRDYFADWAAHNTGGFDYIAPYQWDLAKKELKYYGELDDIHDIVQTFTDGSSGDQWIIPGKDYVTRGWSYNVYKINNSVVDKYGFLLDGEQIGTEGGIAYFRGRVVVMNGGTPTYHAFDMTNDQDGMLTLNITQADTAIYMVVAATPDHFSGLQKYYYRVKLFRGTTTYELTVNNGSGNGNYYAGQVISINANPAPSGHVFDRWTSTGGAVFANVNVASTTLTMPTNDVIVTATYKDIIGKLVNLVFPANGGMLESFTSEYGFGWVVSDLTDGVTNDDGWASLGNPEPQQEFVYSFLGGLSATLNEAVIHAGTAEGLYFSKDVQVWTSTDGNNYTKTGSGTLQSSANTSISLNLGGIVARKVKLMITSGYRSDYWQLGEFELYGALSLTATKDFEHLPSEFVLKQNYPNPFKPSGSMHGGNVGTAIFFTIPKQTKVNLLIFNTLGQEVHKLTDEILLSGSHVYFWKGCDLFENPLPSGVYIYKLQSDSFVAVKKMLLVR